MKSKYLSPWQKRSLKYEAIEETLIRNSKFKPNEIVEHKGRRLTIKHAYVRDGVLGYLAITEKLGNAYFLPESVIA